MKVTNEAETTPSAVTDCPTIGSGDIDLKPPVGNLIIMQR